MFASDTEKDSSVPVSDRSNVTTDDEFFDELMDAPPEFEDRLIPDHCKTEVEAIEHLTQCLNRRFSAYPAVYMGPLKDALKAAINPKEINERRPLLIYVNNDKGVYTNLFCKQLLCNEKIIEYLMNNYVVWAWDITYESNEEKLNDFCKNVFPPWTNEKQFNKNLIEQYPLLIVIYRNTNGDYLFDRLIEGSKKKSNADEFLTCLKEFKDKFDSSEQQLEKTKEEAKQQMLLNLLQARDMHRRSKHRNDREFVRSMSMFTHMDNDNNSNSRSAQFSRLLSSDIGMRQLAHEYFSHHPLHREDMIRTFERLTVDSDDADDEDDEQTPTVDRPIPKFP